MRSLRDRRPRTFRSTSSKLRIADCRLQIADETMLFKSAIYNRKSAIVLLALAALGLGGAWIWSESDLWAAQRSLDHHAYPQSRRHLQRYLRSWPSSDAAHLLAARVARLTGDFPTAAQHLDECQRLGTDRATLILERALLDAQRGTLGPADTKILWDRALAESSDTPLILEALTLQRLYANQL